MELLESGETRVSFLASGAGAPVWLMHSGCGRAAQWRSVCELLSASFRVYASDLCGAGETGPWRDVAPFTLESECRPQELLLQALDAPVHLVGHSYGGLVALSLAARHPDRVRSLSLFEPPYFSLLRRQDAEHYAHTLEESERYARFVEAGDFASAARSLMDLTVGPRAWSLLTSRFRDDAASRAPIGLKEHEAILALGSEVDGAARLTMPVQILTGEQSRPALVRTAHRLHEALPTSVLREMPVAGHMGPLTHPRLFVQLLEAHFR